MLNVLIAYIQVTWFTVDDGQTAKKESWFVCVSNFSQA